jgi:hypothetical protein
VAWSSGDPVATDLPRPAFYALTAGGWRDYVTLLHLPYTAWHLSYVAIGAALAPSFSLSRFLPTVAAFALAVGVGAHALDELSGRPLGTRIPGSVLVALAVLSIIGAVAIGVYGALAFDPWIGMFVVVGAVTVVGYNLELVGGRLHNDLVFALAWGAFPLLAGYFAVAEELTWPAILAASFGATTSYAQRLLSRQVRDVRRRVVRIEGRIERRDGSSERITGATLIAAEEAALQALAAALVLLAVALLVIRLS